MTKMIFRNFGGIQQYVISDAADLARIDQLDPALWAATSAPLRDFQCDPAVLAHLDPEGTGRIRVDQLVAGRDWLFSRLAQRQRIAERSDVLRLDDLAAETPAGALLKQAAEHVVTQLGLADKGLLTLAGLRSFRASYSKLLTNGDGVVPPDLVPEPEVAAFMRDVMSVVGGTPDASGLAGIGEAQLDRFIDRGRAWSAWKSAALGSGTVLPWGADTASVAQLVDGLDAKVAEFFSLCALLQQTDRSAQALRLSDEQVRTVAAQPGVDQFLSAAPLATPDPQGILPLLTGVNPAYAERLAALRTQVVPVVLGGPATSLSRADWLRIRATLQPFRDWQAQKPLEPFDKLSDTALEAALNGPFAARVRHFVALDRAGTGELEQLVNLEKLLLLQRWLIEISNNFVNFSALYDPAQQPLMNSGSLVIDGRRLDFCVRVEDRAAHRKVATESALYLVYASITERDGKPAVYEVVTPVTSGDRGRLRVGKRGLFIDRAGKEWDATVVDILENPVSLSEAVRAPFRRASAFVNKRIEELAARTQESSEKAGTARLADTVDHGLPAGPPPAEAAAVKKADGIGMRDLMLGGGIAFAALGSALAYVVSALAKVEALNVIAALSSIVVAVAALSAFLAWLKLRRRDMAPLLEANGWALNAHMGVTARLGHVFTRIPALPAEAVFERVDALVLPGGTRPTRRRILLALLVLAGLIGGVVLNWRR